MLPGVLARPLNDPAEIGRPGKLKKGIRIMQLQPTNTQRAERALQTIKTFPEYDDNDLEATITDLICDTMHLCDQQQFNFIKILNRAMLHYTEECTEKLILQILDLHKQKLFSIESS